MIRINRQRSFSKESDYDAFASVRVHNRHIKELGGRNAWVYIGSEDVGVYRTVRGHGSITPFPEDAIELDYDSAVELSVQYTTSSRNNGQSEEPFYSCDLIVRPVRRLETIKAHWQHPNPAYRIPLQISLVLGAISILLGLAGIILGLLSIIDV